MKKNLFIYESHYGTTKRTAEIFALLAANSKVCDVNNINVNLNLYDKVFFAVGFHGIDTFIFTRIHEGHEIEEFKRRIFE